jgi:hypothetical protein
MELSSLVIDLIIQFPRGDIDSHCIPLKGKIPLDGVESGLTHVNQVFEIPLDPCNLIKLIFEI